MTAPAAPVCQGASPSTTPGLECPDGTTQRDAIADRELRNILGLDEGDDPHPLEAYDIGCDEGAWNAFLRKLWCGAQALPFAFGKWSIGLGTDLMGWALDFRLANSLAPVAGLLSRVYDASLVGPLGLRQLAWTLAMFAAGWHLLRGRWQNAQGLQLFQAPGARAASEIASTFLTAAIGSIILANPQGYLEGSIALAQNTSGAVLEAVSDTLQPGSQSQDPDAVRDRLDGILRQSFVAESYDLINWGEPLTGDCAAARDEILSRGPWGSDDEPRSIMRDHGCDDQADYNANPTDSRAVASVIVMGASVAATVLLAATALAVFMAQLTLVALFSGASVCWTLALFPGPGRELLWWWLSRLAWAVMATVGATFVLSWLAITVTAALNATTDFSIIQRCLVVLLVIVFAFRLRSHVGRQAEALSHRLGNRVAQTVGQPSRAPAVAAGVVAGFGLSAMARSWAFDAPGGQYAYNRLYARHFTRGYRHRGNRLARAQHAVRRVEALDRRVTDAGLNAARTVRRGARAALLTPVLAPRAIATTRTRATAASARARARLDQARSTRRQWTRNVRHPIEAVRATSGPTPRPAPARPSTRGRPGQPPSRTFVGKQARGARASAPDQARDRRYRAQLDAWRRAQDDSWREAQVNAWLRATESRSERHPDEADTGEAKGPSEGS